MVQVSHIDRTPHSLTPPLPKRAAAESGREDGGVWGGEPDHRALVFSHVIWGYLHLLPEGTPLTDGHPSY